MLPFRPRGIAGNVWPPVAANEISQPWAMFLELERTQWLPPADLEAAQLTQLRALMAHCHAHVPFYHDLWRRHGVDPAAVRSPDDFRRLPTVTRADYQEQFPRCVALAL